MRIDATVTHRTYLCLERLEELGHRCHDAQMQNFPRRQLCVSLLTALAMTSLNACDSPVKAPTSLLTGGLNGCEFDAQYWSLSDDTLIGQTTSEKPLWFPGVYGNFELLCDVRITGGNSGVQYRTEPREDGEPRGFQADFDAAHSYTGRLYEGGEGERGLINERGESVQYVNGVRTAQRFADAATVDAAIHRDTWNTYRIIAINGLVTHDLNGVLLTRVEEDVARRKDGRIGVQLHVGEPMKVEYKNFRITPIDADDETAWGGR